MYPEQKPYIQDYSFKPAIRGQTTKYASHLPSSGTSNNAATLTKTLTYDYKSTNPQIQG